MKYTRNESNEVIEVKGCQTCPHMTLLPASKIMVCTKGAPGMKRNKQLVGRWTGAYHASCPLASKPENVPALPEVKK